MPGRSTRWRRACCRWPSAQATRLIEYLDDASKTYVARVSLRRDDGHLRRRGRRHGEARCVGADGAGGRSCAAPSSWARSSSAPPAYSAIKLAGKPLYRYAREGTASRPRSRTVRIEAIELLGRSAAAEAEIAVRCGKGTYIRSLAHDLGERLGCGAHLAALRRTSSGGFSIDDAHTPDDLVARLRSRIAWRSCCWRRIARSNGVRPRSSRAIGVRGAAARA